MNVPKKMGIFNRIPLRKTDEDNESRTRLLSPLRICFSDLWERTKPDMTKKTPTLARPANRRRMKGSWRTYASSGVLMLDVIFVSNPD
jgi:hypothetical protein